jgi:hypothetical protein
MMLHASAHLRHRSAEATRWFRSAVADDPTLDKVLGSDVWDELSDRRRKLVIAGLAVTMLGGLGLALGSAFADSAPTSVVAVLFAMFFGGLILVAAAAGPDVAWQALKALWP